MNTGAIDVHILWPAFLAGILVTATHVPLGIQVLSRGIVFIDLAIAQIAGLGVICADWLGFEPQGWGVQGAALLSALAGALVARLDFGRLDRPLEVRIGISGVDEAGAIANLESEPGNFDAVVYGMLEVKIIAHQNGQLEGLFSGKRDTGRWSVSNGRLCIMLSRWTDGKSSCSEVVASNGWYRGNGVRFKKF